MRTALAIIAILVIVGAAAGAWLIFDRPPVETMPMFATNISTAVLTGDVAATAPNADQLRRGQYLLRAGDCMVCHTKDGGTPFAGGYPLQTPFGIIYSTNLTPDPATGIGNLTADQFYAALYDGKGPNGPLYPAMPYTYFTHVSRDDTDAMFAYLKSLPAVNAAPPANRLPFPFNVRQIMYVWNALFFPRNVFTPDASKPAQWNRGAYLVEGLGHCGACHTPKNALAGDERANAYQGGLLDNWLAPDLTSNAHTGLGSWSNNEITDYLDTGRNLHANAGGPMADVVTFSTSLLSDQDRAAIAIYLKSLAASPDVATAAADPGQMKRGAAIYSDACASCHLDGGAGQAGIFPVLHGDAVAQQSDPTTVLHLILAGGRTAPTDKRPTAVSMPSFSWKLSDAEIADVATYVRNSWGNRAAPVMPAQVAALRRGLDLNADRLTANSTDR